MPGVLQFVVEFFFTVIILRGIVANEINKEMRKLWKKLKVQYRKFEETGNRTTIANHYRNRTLGNDHKSADVRDCRHSDCSRLLMA